MVCTVLVDQWGRARYHVVICYLHACHARAWSTNRLGPQRRHLCLMTHPAACITLSLRPCISPSGRSLVASDRKVVVAVRRGSQYLIILKNPSRVPKDLKLNLNLTTSRLPPQTLTISDANFVLYYLFNITINSLFINLGILSKKGCFFISVMVFVIVVGQKSIDYYHIMYIVMNQNQSTTFFLTKNVYYTATAKNWWHCYKL